MKAKREKCSLDLFTFFFILKTPKNLGYMIMEINKINTIAKINEQFTQITFFYNENDVQSAINTYGALSSLNALTGTNMQFFQFLQNVFVYSVVLILEEHQYHFCISLVLKKMHVMPYWSCFVFNKFSFV